MGAVITGVGQGADLVPPLVVGPSAERCAGSPTTCRCRARRSRARCSSPALCGRRADRACPSRGPSRDHTERLLLRDGRADHVGCAQRDARPDRLGPARCAIDAIAVPGDPSASAFLLAARGGRRRRGPVTGRRASTRPAPASSTRSPRWAPRSCASRRAGPAASRSPTCRARAAAARRGAIAIGGDLTVRAIDEIPILSAVAARARGTTVIRDAEELRVKESDRIATTAAMLRGFGVNVEIHADGLSIEGRPDEPLRAAQVHAAGRSPDRDGGRGRARSPPTARPASTTPTTSRPRTPASSTRCAGSEPRSRCV